MARRLDAAMFVSLHMDSAPNPLARGASVYSLSDVASDAEAARFAALENAAVHDGRGATARSTRCSPDLAMSSQMSASADARFAAGESRRAASSSGRSPHRFAAFHVLRRAETPAVLFEAGYLSNADDELLLRRFQAPFRHGFALAQAIEADVAARARR